MGLTDCFMFSTQLHPTIFNVERYVGWGCILNCFTLSSLPCSMLFADLLSLHLVTFLMFFIFVHVTFLLAADACLS